MIAIALNLTDGEVNDLSTEERARLHLRGMTVNTAVYDSEVLIRGNVPSNAISNLCSR